MSTKLLHKDDSSVVQAIAWQAAGSPRAVVPASQHGGQQNPAEDVAAYQQRIQRLEIETEQKIQHAHQQGYSAGQAASEHHAAERMEPILARLAKTVEELTGLRRRVRTEAEEDAVRLAVAIARKVMHREFSIDPEALTGLVKAALQRIDARELHRVRFHPDDIPALERHLQAVGMPARLEVLADPAMERGGAVFETSRGNLDASISTQLAEIERGFIDVVRRRADV